MLKLGGRVVIFERELIRCEIHERALRRGRPAPFTDPPTWKRPSAKRFRPTSLQKKSRESAKQVRKFYFLLKRWAQFNRKASGGIPTRAVSISLSIYCGWVAKNGDKPTNRLSKLGIPGSGRRLLQRYRKTKRKVRIRKFSQVYFAEWGNLLLFEKCVTLPQSTDFRRPCSARSGKSPFLFLLP